jgi:uroporphyrinogen decarboxylase
VDILVEQTDINCVNPLEIPPMGDVNLAEVKKTRGSQIALMGNLHTTELMLFGTPEQVYQASVEAIQDGAQGGGFILSTGDQCPRETPDENIFAMIQATKDSGQY